MGKKYIYVLVSQTGTRTSKLIQKQTKTKYCHVSLSLDEGLEKMYSFGRRLSWTPFFGGFIRESVKEGIFQRFPQTQAVLLRFEISKEQKEKINARFGEMYENRRRYKYDYFGAFMAKYRKEVRRKYKLHCARFSRKILEEFGVIEKGVLPKAVYPQDFVDRFRSQAIFEGRLQDYLKGLERKDAEVDSEAAITQDK